MLGAVNASSIRKWVVTLLPWAITACILGYIGLTTDLQQFWETLRNTNFLGFVPTVLAVCITVFLFDTWCLRLLFTRFNAPTTYREMLPLKGTSYFLNVINYNAAAAGIALFFKKRKGVPFLEALSSMLWMNFIDIVSLALLMLLGMGLAGVGGLGPDEPSVLLGTAGFILLVLVGSCIYWNAGFNWLILGRFRTWTIFTAFKKATLKDYAQFIGLRVAFVGTYIVSQWACMPFFNLDASLRELFLFVPVLTFVGTIPLTTVAGMGTVQVLMRHYFYDFVPPNASEQLVHAHIDAYSTTTILSFVLCRILIGYVFMGSVAKDFSQDVPTETHSEDSSEKVA